MDEVSNFIKKWQGQIGRDWVDPTTLEEIFSSDIVHIPGWNEEVTKAAIKNWALMNRDLNALWLDEEYAKKSKWGGIIAPPTFLFSISDGVRHGQYILREGRQLGIPFDQELNVGCEWEFFEPVRPGDKITAKTKLADVYEKQGRRAKLLFVVDETRYTNQKGELVATNRGTVILTRESTLGR